MALVNERRQRVVELYLKGMTQEKIALEVSVSAGQVSMDLKAIHAKWLEQSLADVAVIKEREVAKLRLLEETAWDAWERSKKKLVEVKRKEAFGDPLKGGASIVKEKKLVERVGDPRYLDVILRCREQLAKIYGLYQDVNINVTRETIFDQIVEEAGQRIDDSDRIERRLQYEGGEVIDGKVIKENE